MQARAPLWRSPCILTLTIDRRQFQSPQDAHRTVTSGKFIPRLMRLLGVKLWVWVLEFQQETGDGWPHWHLCIDLADLPGHRIDLARAWKLWRDTWSLGGLDLSERRRDLSAPHALNYITKYLTKSPRAGYPEWVLHAHTIRFVQGCRALGPLVGKLKLEGEEEETEDDSDDSLGKPEPHRLTNLESNAKCGLTSTVMVEEIDGCTGDLRYRYLGALPYSPGMLCQLLPDLFKLFPDPMRERRSAVSFRGESKQDVKDVRAWLDAHADPVGYLASETNWQRECILSVNDYRLRAKPPDNVTGIT